jgi:hypothetical protein
MEGIDSSRDEGTLRRCVAVAIDLTNYDRYIPISKPQIAHAISANTKLHTATHHQLSPRKQQHDLLPAIRALLDPSIYPPARVHLPRASVVVLSIGLLAFTLCFRPALWFCQLYCRIRFSQSTGLDERFVNQACFFLTGIPSVWRLVGLVWLAVFSAWAGLEENAGMGLG